MRILLIVNAFASSVTARSMVVINKAFSADHDVTLAETSRRGHATRLALGAANEGYDVVVVMGGDGTLNEAANGLDRHRHRAGHPARRVDQRVRPHHRAAQRSHRGHRRAARRAGRRNRSARSASAWSRAGASCSTPASGFDAAVVEQVERRSSLKRYAGHPLFVYAGFATWFRHYDHSRPRMAVAPGRRHAWSTTPTSPSCSTRARTPTSATVASTSPRRPRSTPACPSWSIRTMDFVKTLALVGSGIGSGRHLRSSRHACVAHDLDHIEITGHGPFPYQVDGDFLGQADERSRSSTGPTPCAW